MHAKIAFETAFRNVWAHINAAKSVKPITAEARDAHGRFMTALLETLKWAKAGQYDVATGELDAIGKLAILVNDMAARDNLLKGDFEDAYKRYDELFKDAASVGRRLRGPDALKQKHDRALLAVPVARVELENPNVSPVHILQREIEAEKDSAAAAAAPARESEDGGASATDDLGAVRSTGDTEPEAATEPDTEADDDLDALLSVVEEPSDAAAEETAKNASDVDVDAFIGAVDYKSEALAEDTAETTGDDDLDALLAAADEEPIAAAEESDRQPGGSETGAYRVNFGKLTGPRPNPSRSNASPFRIAVLGDFSGRASAGKLETGDALAARKPIKVDIDNLDEVIGRMGIEVSLPIGIDGAAVTVPIRSIDDFHPDELYENLEIFEELSGLRMRLNNSATFAAAAEDVRAWGVEAKGKKRPMAYARGAVVPVGGKLSDFARLVGRPSAGVAPETAIDALLKQVVGPHMVPDTDPRQDELVAAVDEALSDAMRSVLHHPDFQSLESIWRSIDLLVRRVETSVRLQIVLYDVSAEEVAVDLSVVEDLEESGLYKMLVEQPALDAHQSALSAIIGGYTFEMTPPHAELLGRLAKIAAHGEAPFITAMGAECLSLDYDEMHPLIRQAWGALRELSEAAYLGLALPRFMLRMPYGAETDPVDPFEFEEFTAKTGLRSMLWGNPALIAGLLLGEGVARDGLTMQLGSVMTVGDMPFNFYTDAEGDQTDLPCTERLVSVRVAEKMTAQCFMPLVSLRGRPEIRLGSFQSVGGGLLAGLWTGPAEAAVAASRARADTAAQMVGAPKTDAGADEHGDDLENPPSDETAGQAEASGEAELDALLASLDSGDRDSTDAEPEMDPELAALLADL